MKKFSLLLSSLFFLLASCAPKGPATLTVMTHDSFAISEDVVKSFEDANNVKVSFLQSGDAGSVLNQAILTKDAPLADVLFGVDNTFLSRALDADIFEAYQSPALSEVPSEFVLDETYRALPVDYGDVCINYDKNYFAENNLVVPQSFEDLAKPEYKGLLVVEDPATSSPGLAFMLATRAYFGDGYLDYWQNLKDNGVVVVDGWETAYYTNFSASSGKGPQPMVVSYASSPAAEVFFASTPLTESPTGSIVASSMCFRQIEFVGILKNGQNRDLAQKFVDYMLSKQFQEDMPLNMFVYPVNQTADLPEVFTQYAQVTDQPATISYAEIATNRDAWIEAWTQVMK
ncbi:MAG: thiamine ABC transporter substrate-binding protein [Anaerolineales bacterium]|nr:thiamine ABC transporter substrate-binding protein [Anaerolineales bacterium]